MINTYFMIYFLEIPSGEQVHCVAGRINSQGRITLTYRQCNESLPVICEVPTSDVTSVSPSSTETTATVIPLTKTTTTSPRNIINDSGITSFRNKTPKDFFLKSNISDFFPLSIKVFDV